nr:hypothetical protein [Tanacetum cinerariifolium]
IMKQDKAKQVARDKKLVPSDKRVKIGISNLRIDPSITQRDETFQFWLTIEKVKKSSSYQFNIDHKMCQIDVDIFRKILGEIENRQVSRKIRTSRAVVIQEPPSAPTKKIKESSGKLKGIEMLSIASKLELETQKAIKESQRVSRLRHKSGSLSEGTCVSPGVPDELTGVQQSQSDDDVWGSTDEETIKDNNEDDDEDDVSKEEEDEVESVSEESENEEESVNSDDHEIAKEGKTVAKTEEEETANSEHEEDDTKGDDQAKESEVGVPDLVTNKEKLEFLQSTSSHLISLNFVNQFLVNSPNASLIGTILDNANKEITSLMDIEIQQDVHLV